MKYHILTTGISLLTNFINAQHPRLSLSEALRRHKDVQKHFLADPVAASAEINSLNARTRFLAEKQPVFGATLIYTETDEGKMVTSLLEKFLKKQGIAPLYKIQVKICASVSANSSTTPTNRHAPLMTSRTPLQPIR